MADRYSQVVNAPVVSTIAKQLGLPQPVSLDRYQPGQPALAGPVLTGAAPGGRLGKQIAAVLDSVRAERAGAEGKAKALVFGFIAAVVASYKGCNAGGGPKGVGDAVNQSVVITFLLLFIVNFVMSAIFLQIIPSKAG